MRAFPSKTTAMRLKIKVITKASHDAVEEEEGVLKVAVTAPPEKGKANEAVVKLLAAHFGVAKKRITIVSGLSSRHKWIDIQS